MDEIMDKIREGFQGDQSNNMVISQYIIGGGEAMDKKQNSYVMVDEFGVKEV